MKQQTILFAANRGYALLSSRRTLIERFLCAGWRVVLATADDDESRTLADLGATLEPLAFNRGGFSPLADWRVCRRLRQVMRKWSPSLAHFFNAKPVMIGTLAARWELGDAVRVVNTITGLGHAFIRGGMVTRLAGAGYWVALPRADMTIFQNRDDRTLFLDKRWTREHQAKLIPGSGVPLDRFAYVDRRGRDPSRLVVVMLGRLLNQKGVPEFAKVAGRIRKEIPGARFYLAGEEEPDHPDAVDMDWLRNTSDLEYVGRLTDVVPLFEKADLLVFPSYYREGVPRVVMEAAATGLPTVAFDVPGVREAVRNGETGYLVPDRDVDELTARVAELLDDSEQRRAMGVAARRLTEEAFDIRAIQEQYLALYRELGIAV